MKKIKQKTRKGVSKRFKITGTGKVMRRAQNMRHLRRHKSKKAKLLKYSWLNPAKFEKE